jgi:hypothetical protein
MFHVRNHLSLVFLFTFANQAFAQLDSTILLRPSGKSPSKQTLDSTRYKIRAPESRRDDTDEKPGAMIPTPVKKPSKVQPTEVTVPSQSEPIPSPVPSESQPAEKTEPTPQTSSATSVTPEPAPAPNGEPAPVPVTQQVRDLFLGEQEEINEYKSKIHPQDPRANVVQISMAPAYYYNSSASSYSYRRYNSNGPAMGLGMNLWLTPFFGVQSRYFTNMSSSIRSGPSNMAPAEMQTLEAGIRFRKHFGTSRKSSYITWGLDYHDARTKIGKESTTSVGTKSYGLGLALEAVVPVTTGYAHTLQVNAYPRLKHGESATGVSIRSGDKSETNAIGFGLGGQWTLDRRNQIFWKAQYTVERNQFKGDASDADPVTGNTPSGVSVTNSTGVIYFGFSWGS